MTIFSVFESFQEQRLYKSMPNTAFKTNLWTMHQKRRSPSHPQRWKFWRIHRPTNRPTSKWWHLTLQEWTTSRQWSHQLCHQLSQSNPTASSHVQYRSWKSNWFLMPSRQVESTRLDHDMTGPQDMLPRGRCGDAEETDTTVTMVRPQRQSLWSREKEIR